MFSASAGRRGEQFVTLDRTGVEGKDLKALPVGWCVGIGIRESGACFLAANSAEEAAKGMFMEEGACVPVLDWFKPRGLKPTPSD